jgi:DNA-binding winged helix-turn-helix (wHTH) protein
LIYHFGRFRLDPAARELREGDNLLDLARRTFDGLVFLVEHRDRAVSRDELIDALWGRPVEDIQVTQLVMRLRRLLGDDSHEPSFIRAVPGFGYRWIAETEIEGELPDGSTPSMEFDAAPDPGATPPRSGRPGQFWPIAATVVLAILVLAYFLLGPAEEDEVRLVREPGEAIVVLPLEVPGNEFADIGWARLGAMDLVALAAGNILLGNPEDAAAIEIAMFPFEVRFLADTHFALIVDTFDDWLGDKPNQTEVALAGWQILRRVAATGTAVLVFDHSGKTVIGYDDKMAAVAGASRKAGPGAATPWPPRSRSAEMSSIRPSSGSPCTVP